MKNWLPQKNLQEIQAFTNLLCRALPVQGKFESVSIIKLPLCALRVSAVRLYFDGGADFQQMFAEAVRRIFSTLFQIFLKFNLL